MRNRIDERFEQRLLAVLRNVHAGWILAGRDIHVLDGETDSVGHLLAQGAGDFLRIDLPRGTVPSTVTGRRNDCVRKPLLWSWNAQQHASYRGAQRPGVIGSHERHFLEGLFGGGPALGAQQGHPERSVQSLEPGIRNDPLIKRAEPRLASPLSQAQPLVTGHHSLRAANPDIALAAPLVERVSLRNIQNQNQLVPSKPEVVGGYTNRRLDDVSTYVNQERVQRRGLLAGHALYLSIVRGSAEQNAAIRIGERDDLGGEVLAPGTRRLISGEPDFRELPSAVFASLQLAFDFFAAVTHGRPPDLAAPISNGRQGNALKPFRFQGGQGALPFQQRRVKSGSGLGKRTATA